MNELWNEEYLCRVPKNRCFKILCFMKKSQLTDGASQFYPYFNSLGVEYFIGCWNSCYFSVLYLNIINATYVLLCCVCMFPELLLYLCCMWLAVDGGCSVTAQKDRTFYFNNSM